MDACAGLALAGSFTYSQTREAPFCFLILAVILLLAAGRIVLDGIQAQNLLQDAEMGRRRIRQGVGRILIRSCYMT